MTKVLILDVSMTCGFGVLSVSRQTPFSGSFQLPGNSSQMGVVLTAFENRLRLLIEKHQPTVIGAASPWIGPKSNPANMRILFGMESFLQKIADDVGIEFERVYEPDARKAFMGSVPRKSAAIKAAVIAECRIRGWPVRDDHAADALCCADFVLNKREPSHAHERTPLFVRRRVRRS